MALDKKATHYDAGGIEPYKVLKAKLTPEQFKGWCLGNAIVYQLRYNWKHTKPEDKKRDIEKAITQLQMILEEK